MSAVGVNLTISLDAASHLLTSSFETSAAVAELTGDDDPKVVNQEWKTGIKLSDHLLNLSCIKSGGQTKLIFNHHFEAGSAPNAARVLKDNALFSRLKHLSETIATQLESGENNVSQRIIL